MAGAEQLSFAGAAVAFNWAASKFEGLGGNWAIISVSALTFHLILSRWILAAGLCPKGSEPARPDHQAIDQGTGAYVTALRRRVSWTVWELRTELKAIPYVVAEASGSLFLLLGVGLSCFLAVASISGKNGESKPGSLGDMLLGGGTNVTGAAGHQPK
jgi:hypothetical protein